jgi:hypothetical protein
MCTGTGEGSKHAIFYNDYNADKLPSCHCRATRIRLHRIRSGQMYHHYLGDPLEVLLLYPGGIGASWWLALT